MDGQTEGSKSINLYIRARGLSRQHRYWAAVLFPEIGKTLPERDQRCFHSSYDHQGINRLSKHYHSHKAQGRKIQDWAYLQALNQRLEQTEMR